MKFEVYKFKSVTSTNDEAINLIKKSKQLTGCIYADTQTKGRGTKGREWISESGNFFGSVFFPLREDYPPFNEFSIINPVIISEIINKFCKNKKISFKWPNDVMVNNKKICGILQEIITLNSKKFLIVGIGINIISNPKINAKYEATNIFLESKKKPSIEDLIKLIIFSYESFFSNLKSYNFLKFKKKVELITTRH